MEDTLKDIELDLESISNTLIEISNILSDLLSAIRKER
jgi:hypothetical protein